MCELIAMAEKLKSALVLWREGKGMTLAQAAEAFGVTSKGYLSEIENGGRCSVALAMTIERVTEGAVAAHDLNPDVALIRSAA